ncbi:hypothetical protein ABTY98_05200 [Streptomyces sp. NPDC096040]|uniref:hypothetical protein n=1 Tax=Streptomyces sp. NPDC096040 TaxID=3155541 RepID=UPI00331C79C7
MVEEGAKLVCKKCGGWFDQGVTQGRRLVAAGIIARRAGGRSLRLTCTAAGVTGHLRRTAPAVAGGCR